MALDGFVWQTSPDELWATLGTGANIGTDETKETIVSFSRKHPARDMPPLTIGENELERISCVKVLELMISDGITRHARLNYVCVPQGQQANLPFVHARQSWCASQSDLLAFYKTSVMSAVEYASSVYGTLG